MSSSDIRTVSAIWEYDAVVELQAIVWGRDEVTPRSQLIAICRNGGVLVGAFAGDVLCGFAFGFPGFARGETWLCSHMLAVRPEARGRGLGKALKLAEREEALRLGYRRMTWTYDPLEARNARLNLNALGARAEAYVIDYYGEMDDELNRGLPSDRLVVAWDLTRPARGAEPGKMAAPVAETGEEEAAALLVPIPADWQSLRRQDLTAARRWRLRVRAVVPRLLARGYELAAVVPFADGYAYLARRRDPGLGGQG